MKNLMDNYINKFDKDEQKQMNELRTIVQGFAPSTEGISYSMPSFKLGDSVICCFAMYKNHLGFYPYSGNITKLFKKELSGYKTSSGAVQFPKNKPLPKTLIAKLLQARLEEIANNTLYYYTCPKPLGYLEIILDTTGRVKTAVFVEKKGSGKTLPDTLRTALDSYFKSRKNIPSNLVSKKLKGTDFQKSIWTVISKAPFGKTITYTDMAKKVGSENAVRAAGTACGKNPVALFIPCHRVVRKEGEDYGYAWGIERKKWLLDFEK